MLSLIMARTKPFRRPLFTPGTRANGMLRGGTGPLEFAERTQHTIAALSSDDVNLPRSSTWAPDHLRPRSQVAHAAWARSGSRREGRRDRCTAAPAGGAAPPGHASSVLPHRPRRARHARQTARSRALGRVPRNAGGTPALAPVSSWHDWTCPRHERPHNALGAEVVALIPAWSVSCPGSG
jgi:hypothetical protein